MKPFLTIKIFIITMVLIFGDYQVSLNTNAHIKI
jgi:hypothetical protein